MWHRGSGNTHVSLRLPGPRGDVMGVHSRFSDSLISIQHNLIRLLRSASQPPYPRPKLFRLRGTSAHAAKTATVQLHQDNRLYHLGLSGGPKLSDGVPQVSTGTGVPTRQAPHHHGGGWKLGRRPLHDGDVP